MKLVLAAVLAFTICPAHAVPLCGAKQVPCWSQEKIDKAYQLLNGKYDKDYIASIEMSRGKFRSAQELAEWIVSGDR